MRNPCHWLGALVIAMPCAALAAGERPIAPAPVIWETRATIAVLDEDGWNGSLEFQTAASHWRVIGTMSSADGASVDFQLDGANTVEGIPAEQFALSDFETVGGYVHLTLEWAGPPRMTFLVSAPVPRGSRGGGWENWLGDIGKKIAEGIGDIANIWEPQARRCVELGKSACGEGRYCGGSFKLGPQGIDCQWTCCPQREP